MKKLTMIVLLISILALTGCAAISPGSALNAQGLPKDKYLIGRAWEIEYQASQDGHIYLVDENSGTIILIEPLSREDSYDFYIEDFQDLHDSDIKGLQSMGVDPSNMKLVLYFVPERPAPSTGGSEK